MNTPDHTAAAAGTTRPGRQPIEPVPLSGQLVALELLSQDHGAGLQDAVQDGRQWELWYANVPRPEEMSTEIDRRTALQDSGTLIPYATRRLTDGRVIGMTTFLNIDREIPRLDIGSTWNAASASGTGTNAESKLLMMTQAFEVWGVAAVEFRTDWMNMHSRAAIERLGAKRDGVLRQQSLRKGYVRDTVVYSVVAAEWPAVKLGLEHRLMRALRRAVNGA